MRNMRKILGAMLIAAVMVSLLTGCRSTKYKCDPGNLIGFEGYYYADGKLNIAFEADSLDDNLKTLVYEKKNWPEDGKISVALNVDKDIVAKDDEIDVTIQGDILIVSLAMDSSQVSKISGLSIEAGTFEYEFYIDEGTLEIDQYCGEYYDCYSQEYNKWTGEWSEPEYKQVTVPVAY